MKIIFPRVQSPLYSAVALMTLMFFGIQLKGFFSARYDLAQTLREINTLAPNHYGTPGGVDEKASAGGMEGLLSDCAKQSNLKKLLSVGTKDNLDSREIHLDWEANQFSTARFLQEAKSRGLIGPCLKLQLSGAEQGSASLRGVGVFQSPSGVPRGKGSSLDATRLDPFPDKARDVFVQLWATREPEQLAMAVQRDLKKEEEARIKEQERQMQEQKIREEAQRLESKRQLLQSFSVTGIVNNGREVMAFLTNSGNGKSVVVRRGDTIEDAKVTSIDEDLSEVHLDYSGKIQTTLKLNSQANPILQ